jgi:hypothetical protein
MHVWKFLRWLDMSIDILLVGAKIRQVDDPLSIGLLRHFVPGVWGFLRYCPSLNHNSRFYSAKED